MADVEDLISLIYVSTAASSLTEQDLEDILVASRRNNAARELTGMLLYADGLFIQVLEGPVQMVRAMYDRIAEDPRHTDVMTLMEEAIPTRSFSQWLMAYARAARGEVAQVDGFRELSQADQLLRSVLERYPKRSLSLLRHFRSALPV